MQPISVLLLLSCLSAFLNVVHSENHCKCRLLSKPKIVGGIDLAHNEFPWYVSIGHLMFNSTFLASEEYKQNGRHYREMIDEEDQLNTHVCGGTILNEQFILTAAHCLNAMKHQLGVGVGNFLPDIFLNGRIPIKQFWVHPQYSMATGLHDVAVAKLAYPLTFADQIQPGCFLNEVPHQLLRQHILTAIGHGVTLPPIDFRALDDLTMTMMMSESMPRYNSYNLKMLHVYQSAEEHSICHHPNFMCARSYEKEGAICNNDSGSPLHLQTQGMSLVIGIAVNSNEISNELNQIDVQCSDGVSGFVLLNGYTQFIENVIQGTFCQLVFEKK